MRFWDLVNRQNRTIRPDAPILNNFLDMTMEKIHKKVAPRQDELKLFLEMADKPFNGKFGKVGDIIPILCKIKNFLPNTPLKIYEEVKPNMIEEMKLRWTFKRSEIQNGDIICFQKVLTEREIQKYTDAGRIHDIPTFYESLSMRVVIKFKPKHREQKPEFELILNKNHKYDDVAKRVAAFLNIDPLKLQFTTALSPSGSYKTVIKRVNNQTLSEMLNLIYHPTMTFLYYEMLDISIIELETKKFFKVYWSGRTVKEEEVIDVCLPKTAMINEVLRVIVQKLALQKPTHRIRLYDALNFKIQNEYSIDDPIDKIQENMTLYAEEIPQDETELRANDKIIQAFHFTKETFYAHGIPFKFVIKAGEPFSATKLRLQLRLGMNENDFLRVKVAIIQPVSYAKPQYIEDNTVILSNYGLTDELLGLDHVDKTGRAGRLRVVLDVNQRVSAFLQDIEIEAIDHFIN
ncbi:11917_t:CDS:10 [Cetraspora pellucida]|uniref:11917_t:CDS:1 n=1 Tax=Cetraspora pellucida TaxID=1433469 RepID=A0ACA9LSW2_9GLOM|nr:11917_t:CDS:10 [Cetraspora pellucida]